MTKLNLVAIPLLVLAAVSALGCANKNKAAATNPAVTDIGVAPTPPSDEMAYAGPLTGAPMGA
jgi:hypothetical protein